VGVDADEAFAAAAFGYRSVTGRNQRILMKVNIHKTAPSIESGSHSADTHRLLSNTHRSLNIVKTGRARVMRDISLPALDIRSNGTSIPEKKICGISTRGSQTIAWFTVRENALIAIPRMLPEVTAAAVSVNI
jgi:hypothetical protein